jgi:hypothetical protein
MKVRVHPCAIASLIWTLFIASPAHAIVPLAFGTSWDGPGQTLQEILDARYGPGAIDVQKDHIGAHDGDIDPWFWVDHQFSALMVREVAGNADLNVLGWYLENGVKPVIDGVGDGVIFDGFDASGATSFITFDRPLTRFGFYLNPNGTGDAINAAEPELFYTNRLFNDLGPSGAGALHTPFDGDVQALVFDITALTQGTYGEGQQTWLVCFEDLDSGAEPGPCCATTDNDFNDAIFEVMAFGATPAGPISFGTLKARYRK